MSVSMRRIGLVAGREFMAAVMNKGFVIGLLLMPGVVVGFLISRYTAARIDAEHVRPALLTASALCALVVIVRSLAAEL